jgi:signal transduction histidine kinase
LACGDGLQDKDVEKMEPKSIDLCLYNGAVRSSEHEEIAEMLREKSKVMVALERLRLCARDLRPRILDDLGLIAALEWMVDELIEKQGIDGHVEVVGSERSLPDEVQLMLFRIAQEALNNVRRHAEATCVWITMEFGDSETTNVEVPI